MASPSNLVLKSSSGSSGESLVAKRAKTSLEEEQFQEVGTQILAQAAGGGLLEMAKSSVKPPQP